MTDACNALFDAARSVRERAYAPYSGYKVGAAILDDNGNVFCGTNTENASFPLGACAEGNAIGAMVAGGGTRIDRIAIVGGRDAPEDCTPCGGCRQRIAEFAYKQTEIHVLAANGTVKVFTMDELLPAAFQWPEKSAE